MNIPEDRQYTSAHEWVLRDGAGVLTVGISDFAQDALGDIVYVDLPDVGSSVPATETLAEVESTKSVGEVYAPVSGSVVAVNTDLDDNPELVNQDPYGKGWIVKLAPADDADFSVLIDAAAYGTLVADL
ncbi:MAG: glycine cleavage system protein GcvH [Acidimicrobiia bacterium]|nr:glycine cleavage system protein GcvH [Acidimicrobiia bacterium]MDH5422187.1 glycine cleavage system protein GcvH [Acidimicrobiia bacterium]MDH5504981.1 glycine cleavage system protein GcvH [Acidimicrobiia bacterium]